MELPQPDLLIASVGAEIYYGPRHVPDRTWQKQIDFYWDPDAVHKALDGVDGFYLQEPQYQLPFKISYDIDLTVSPSLG